MPRGRHRHSPPLHRLLPPTAVGGASVLCAGGAWLLADPLGLRLLVAAAAAAAVTGAVLMRTWDRTAGRRVAELTRARASDQWKTEERIAELEADLDEARELRARLDAKLRAKRAELAGLRGEHAELLRRYATSETERASTLEERRQLTLGAPGKGGESGQGPASGPGGSGSPGPAAPAAGAGRAADGPAVGAELVVASGKPTATDYLRAARALQDLARNAAAQEARRIAEAALNKAPGAPAPAASAMRHVPAAAAIVPQAAQRRQAPRPEGRFDFFGMEDQKALRKQGGAEDVPAQAPRELAAKQPVAAIEAVQQEDLADVVGEEALAAADDRPQRPRGDEHAVGEVIDLTAHDETEQLDVAELRDAVSS
ncbi:hypothetical protein I3F58_14325 [Streptomyces sp. MUM 203J]|uniref:hypothetical protein n=1 Tax=Streptomyces sp. MUM 203J TaxID=2791990 RepID=UPI001F04098D|nr:hypothetical protein [Streptomyces sp. MUM 203J]MCH0540723.1 hypothetical protein [Streptomyces sp. MUM 203J]